MEKRKIGKYTVTICDSPLMAMIGCGKAKMALTLSVGEHHILKTTDQEKDVTRILKMERIAMNRKLASIERLLSE
jgi:hypothetical protein